MVASYLGLAISLCESRRRELATQLRSIGLISSMVEHELPALRGRAERVAKLTNVIGTELQLRAPQLLLLRNASYLHHLGYLDKAGAKEYTQKELSDDREYAIHSSNLLKKSKGFSDCIPVIQFHRSRIDGTGAPQIKAHGWSIESQVLALAVEIDLAINLPLAFTSTFEPISDVVERILEEGKNIVGKSVLRAFEKTYKKGLILVD